MKQTPVIYLDHAATTPVAAPALEAMIPYCREWYGNPSGGYRLAKDAKRALEEARTTIARIIGAKSHEIYFTSGGTESDNWALQMGMWSQQERVHLITTQIEHHAILNTCKYLEEQGVQVTYLPVNSYGMVSAADVERAIRPETKMISIMYANNEVGTIQPIEEIGRIAAKYQICFHTDGVQAFGQVPIHVRRQNITMLSASSHKCYGPKGVGFLYIKEEYAMNALIHGGGQEQGLRAGTENVAGIVGFAKAARLCAGAMSQTMARERKLRDYFFGRLRRELPQCVPCGPTQRQQQERLPGNIHFCIPGEQSGRIVAELDREGICVSGGSACSSAKTESSHVLAAMGIPPYLAEGAVRITIGVHTTKEELDDTLEQLKRCIVHG